MEHFLKPLTGLLLALGLAAAILAVRSQPGPTPSRDAAAPPKPDLAAVQADPDVHKVAAAGTEFGCRLLARLAPDKPQQNVFFSPFSITQALDLTLNGAGGQTRQDIAATLGLSGLPLETVNAANGLLRPSLENPDPKVEMTVANALWIPQGRAFGPDFQARCKQFYGADTTALDFSSPSGAAAINAWVKGKTQGKIDRIVSPQDLASADAVLTNAVYFHGQWTKQFDKGDTEDAPFTRADGSQKTLPLMSQTCRFSYLETADFQAARLPYGQGRMALYVFLPKSPSGLDDFLKTVTAAQWARWPAQMRPTELRLFLPRFHAEDQRKLNDPLKQMGMASAFGDGADFAPMGLPDSYISAVLHKATLDVDEEGTVAAAATAVIMAERAAMTPRPIPMRVDHPFFCAIRDEATGTILFLGAIRDPQVSP